MGKQQSGKEAGEKPSFEETLQHLEEIVHLLEEGNLGLDEALARYEEGVRLLRQSYDLLRHAERRIELLSGVDAEGNPISRPFDDQATLPPDKDETAESQAGRRSAAGGGSSGRSGEPHTGDNHVDAPGGLF